jgi:hypothetical protein
MKKHFLVTISNDAEILYGVRFLCSFFEGGADHHVTLLHICRRDAEGMSATLSQMWEGPDEGIKGQLTVQAKKAIDRARDTLARHTTVIDKVMTKTCAERYGKVKDILTEGMKGAYDAIILGRRASYTLQWMFERAADETAQAIIRDSGCTIPLWICPEPLPSRKNVLLCLDGSENGYRAADHVGYIVATQPQQHITLFYVQNVKDHRNPAEIFAPAEAILHDHGVAPERIRRESVWGLTVPGAIESEMVRGGYAAVAVGLHGEHQVSARKSPLAGGNTAKLIAKVDKAALWCCP